jgi:uncharacterized SAM-binding protein YcdF (DUF218 family)
MLRRNARSLGAAVLATVVLAAAGFALFQDFVDGLARPSPTLPERVDLIVVLSGGAGRLDEGVRLLREGRAPMLFLVGFQGPAVAQRLENDPEAATLAQEDRIQFEPRSESTLDDAHLTRRVVERRRARSVLLITSVYHVPRARLAFRAILPPDVELHVRPVRSGKFRADGWFEDAGSRRVVFNEFIKYLAYRVWLVAR